MLAGDATLATATRHLVGRAEELGLLDDARAARSVTWRVEVARAVERADRGQRAS
jgi:hypothetical protein